MRKRQRKLLWSIGVFTLGLATSTPSFAQPGPGQGSVDSRAAHRQQLIDRLIEKWSNHLQEVYQQDPSAWITQMAAPYDVDAMDVLERAVAARTFTAMSDAFLRGETATTSYKSLAGDDIVAGKLGDLASDLVFVPITPCRILDTRLAGGPIAANSIRNFDVTAVANYSFQGGDASNCGGAGAAGSFAAAVINFTVVTPAAAGYITAYPYLAAQPLAATVNYVAGDIRGNMAIVRLDQGASADELSVYTLSQTHLVGDLLGYLITPEATDLSCVNTALTSVNVAASTTANATAPACAIGYTQTSTLCETDSWLMPLVFSANGVCSARNNDSITRTLSAARTCCRVPGR